VIECSLDCEAGVAFSVSTSSQASTFDESEVDFMRSKPGFEHPTDPTPFFARLTGVVLRVEGLAT
jgi:hypothetical protein